MTFRERAIELVEDEIERIENGSVISNTNEVMMYALVLALADIGQRLDEIGDTLGCIETVMELSANPLERIE